jgi:hypothetical protein
MSTPLLVIITLLYVGVSASLLWDGQRGLAGMFFCYALANIALIAASKGY